MNRTRTTTILGIISLSAGAYFIYGLLFHELILGINRWDHDPLRPISNPFYVSFKMPFLVPAFMLLHYGWELVAEVDKTNIKGCIGGTVIFAFLWLALFVNNHISEKIAEISFTLFLIGTLFMFWIYVILSKLAMKKANLIPDEKGEFIDRNIISILAILVCFSFSEMVVVIAPDETNSPLYLEPPWGSIANFGSILAAIIFYKAGVHFFVKDREKVTTF